MKKIFLITFWSILLFAGNANAQKYTLSGYIEDSETGEKLISANIFDFRSNSGTVTNTYGFYSLSLDADSLYIDVSYIGYETKTYAILLNKDINLNIELSSSVTLDEIEISAERSTRIEEQSQMSLVEVPVQQIKKIPSLLGEVDVLKACLLYTSPSPRD